MKPKPGRHKYTTSLDKDNITWLLAEVARRKIASWTPSGDPEDRDISGADIINEAIQRMREAGSHE